MQPSQEQLNAIARRADWFDHDNKGATTMTGPRITSDEAKDIVSKKTAPRVTQESIEAKIESVDFMTSRLTTVCFINMQNGFRVIGHSTPASAANYDPAVGERYAYDNAFKQIWQLEGYLLREQLADKRGAGSA